MPSSLELRTRLLGAIADAIEAGGEQIQEIALDTGIGRHEVGRLANQEINRFSLERLVDYCPLFGLKPEMHLDGPSATARGIDQPTWLEARSHPSAEDHTDSGRMSRRLATAIAAAIKESPLTQSALATSVGLSRQTVSKLGTRRVDLYRLDSLVDYAPKFDLTVDITATPTRQVA